MRDSPSVHSQHSLNARLLRFRSQPHSEDAYALAEDLIDAGRYADARSVVALAKPQDREDAALLLLEARAHLLERDLIRAQAALLQAVKVAPSLQAAYRYLGEVLLKRGDPLRAKKTLHRALALRADDAEARALLERAEYLAEAANDSLEALPSDLHSDFEVDAAQRGVELGSEPPASDEPAEEEAPARVRTEPEFAAAPAAEGRAPTPQREPAARVARSTRADEPTSEFQHASHVDPAYNVSAADKRRALRDALPLGAAGPEAAAEADGPRAARSAQATDRGPGLAAASTPGAPRRRAEPGPVERAPEAGAARGRSEPGSVERAPEAGAARRRAEPGPVERAPEAGAARGRSEPGPVERAPEAGAARRRADPGPVERAPEAGAARRRAEPGPVEGAPDAGAARRRAEPGPVERAPDAGAARRRAEPGPVEGVPEPGPAVRRPAAGPGAPVERPSGASRGRSSQPDGGLLGMPPLPKSSSPAGQQRPGFGKRLSDFGSRPGSPSTEPPLPGQQRTAADSAGAPGERAGLAADSGRAADPSATAADQVLALVRQLGLFEEPASQAAVWASRGEVETRGQRVRSALIWLWTATFGLCAAGYFGWHAFVERRHANAASLVSQAHSLTLLGDHGALVDAERMLRVAREQHPASLAVTEEALFVQIERVLEDGERDTASLRSAFARASTAKIAGTGVPLANLLLSAAVTDATAREHALAQVLALAKGDARTLYLLGRAEERMGVDAAAAHFEAAVRAEPKLIPAQLALAERAYERGERAAALRLLDVAVSSAPAQLRVRLFRMLVSADDLAPNQLRQDMNALAEPLRKGNSMDQALAALVRARLARRSAEPKAALRALEAAAKSGADDARVLGWLAEEALVLGNVALAQQLATRALSLAPDSVRSRRLLARILIERGAGQQAFVLLSSLANADADVQIWRAKAALLSNDPELLRAALYTLPQASGKKAEPDVQKAALRLRIETRLDPSKVVLERARVLVHGAPTDPEALLALAEAALALHDAKSAQNALKQRTLLLPDDVQAQTLLGRSLRMSGDVEGAEAAFRHALSLRAGYVDAQAALASLLLDRGQYAAADALYRELALREETALSGRLGRVEALLGQNQLADAQVQLEAAPEAERASAAYREVAAKLALSRGELADALKLLGPLTEEQPKRALVRALYAEALLLAAQLSAAAEQADAALELDPELPEALLCRAELQLLAKKTKDALATLGKAQDALRERVRPPSQQARRLTLLGRSLLLRKKRGDSDAAVRALREASTQPGAAADSYFFLADALSGAKDKAGAQAAARRYLELAPSGPYRQRAQRMLGATR